MTVYRSSEGSGIEQAALRVEMRPLMRLVFVWMGFGLIVTAFASLLTAGSETLRGLLTTELALYGSFFAELAIVVVLSARIREMSFAQAAVMFTVFAAVNGFTLSVVFLVFDLGTIFSAFATTAMLFAVMVMIGFTTRIDLTRYGSYFLMGLIGLLMALLVNLVIGSRPLDLVISAAAVLLFTGLTAHDAQKIRELASDPEIQASADLTMKLSILGALVLYLDFINLFLHLLNLFDSDSSDS